MNLIIVESPTKAKTLTKFLDKKYKIESSYGHIRDLPKSELGIDVENNFAPRYIVPAKAKKNLSVLKKDAKKAEKIILATDEDREGEAIAWHLSEALNINPDKAGRIVFHEITKDAILEALKNPRQIDMKLVDAQQARRVLDRLVGYKLSPLLWKKVAKGLSAGRVQSVTVRLIVEREREIQNFKAQEFWTLEAILNKQGDKKSIIAARLNKINGKTIGQFEIKNEEEANKIKNELKGAKYAIQDIIKKEIKKNPPTPFTTSTLQQTANRWLGFSAKQTMLIAQKLYEEGLITYMRTDSLNLANKFLSEAQIYLKENLGDKYALAAPRRFKTKSKGAQEAHEAIRPTEIKNSPDQISSLDLNQQKLYKLIWQRSLATQMPQAILDSTSIDISAENTNFQFRSNGQVLKFDGYLKIYPEKSAEIILPEVKKGEELDLKELKNEQHFTKPPARYSDAGLVKELEKNGIGRPSTYAPTIATIIARNYANRDENKKLKPTDIAFVVNDLLVGHFPEIVDYKFTAKMENDLDKIAEGSTKWQPVIEEFYIPFKKNLEDKHNSLNKQEIMPEEKSNEVCDKCGAPMIVKTGRFGKFLACSAFPNCRNIKGLNASAKEGSIEKTEEIQKMEEKYKDEKCNKCGEPMVVKNGRFGLFLSCSGYPKCKNIKNIDEKSKTGVKCPNCEKGEIVAKKSRRGVFYGCDQYPDCKTAYWGRPTGKKCPNCESLLVENKDGKIKCSNKECDAN